VGGTVGHDKVVAELWPLELATTCQLARNVNFYGRGHTSLYLITSMVSRLSASAHKWRVRPFWVQSSMNLSDKAWCMGNKSCVETYTQYFQCSDCAASRLG
jgi:hypothetical protein